VYGNRRQNILNNHASDNHSNDQNAPLGAVNQQLPTVDILEIVSITDHVFNLVHRNSLIIHTTDEMRGHHDSLELTHHAQTSALIIINDFVTNNKILSEQQAREKINELQNNQKAAIKEFLITKRFENERIRGTFNDRTLQNWFMYNNPERNFAFLKADMLKNIMKQKRISCAGKSIHDMIKVLGLLEVQGTGENHQERDDEDVVIKKSVITAMLENSFQKPLKG
jgi:hypothetical protein